jgi:hypothetical protein
MPSQPEELRERTKQFAIRIVKLFRALPRTEANELIRIFGSSLHTARSK